MDWKNYIPNRDLAAWHQFDAGVSGHEIIYDRSGFDRHISCGVSNSPILTVNSVGEQPAWFFNGSRDPLTFAGNLSVKHLFIVAAIQTANFTGFNGLLTPPSGEPILIGNGNTSNKFFDLTTSGISNYNYRKSDVSFLANNQIAPLNGQFAVIEMQFADGLNLNGIQIGQDRAFADRKLNGYFAENLMYSGVQDEEARRQIYEYFAMRYQLYRQSNGLNIFPFDPTYPLPVSPIEKMLTSESVSGIVTSRSKGAVKKLFKANFQSADQLELNAAIKFCDAHRDNNQPMIFEDKTFSPALIIPSKVFSRVEYESVGANNFNYSVQFKEI